MQWNGFPDGSLTMDYMVAMRAESIRGVVLVAAAHIDELLEKLLLAYFIQDSKVPRRFLSYPGACSALSSRCDLAYCLGLVGTELYADIRAIAKIRNEFAHTSKGATFEKANISDLCTFLVRSMKAAGTDLSHSANRNLFHVAAGSVIQQLIGICARTSHRNPGPSFSEVIKPEINPFGY